MTVPSQPPKIQLIPWDPYSEEHIERLILQRIACGWHEDFVRNIWCQQQKEGHKSLFWIVLTPSPITSTHLTTHLHNFPLESPPLPNTTKDPLPSAFTPIGHISLDSDAADPPGKLSYDLKNVFRLTNFYISKPLQGLKLGSLAMDEVERLAVGKGRGGLVLSTADEVYEGREEKHVAMGRVLPVHSVPQWYARRGYKPYKTVREAWSDVDDTGKTWWTAAVFMKKDIEG